jgi:dCMP deaminase
MDKLCINQDRIGLDEAYMQMAEVWAKRSKAVRKQVGAIMVKDHQIISDGYNGMPAGSEGDDDVCETWVDVDGPGFVVRQELITKPEVLHGESNCLLKIAKLGGRGAEGSTMYVTMSPCPECAKLIIQAKVARVVYREKYRLTAGIDMLMKYKIKVDQI